MDHTHMTCTTYDSSLFLDLIRSKRSKYNLLETNANKISIKENHLFYVLNVLLICFYAIKA